MKTLPVTITLLLSVLTVAPLTAQEATATPDAGWPVEQRCVDDPTTPPDGWTFDGAILMGGWAGIHAFQAGWETPHVMAFMGRYRTLGRTGGGLSPDKHWYVVLEGRIEYVPDWQGMYGIGSAITHRIRVFSTLRPHETYSVPWEDEFYYEGSLNYRSPQMYWYDNEHLVFHKSDESNMSLINPFTSEISQQEGLPFGAEEMYISPNHKRFVYNDLFAEWIVEDVDNGEINRILLTLGAANISWSPDSAHFVASIYRDYNFVGGFPDTELLALFDQDGNRIEVIFDPRNGGYESPFSQAEWTPDGKYLAFNISDAEYSRHRLFIADMQVRQITDTCLKVSNDSAWSPDGRMLAFMAEGYEHRPVYVLDLAAWQVYTVAYHQGSVIGWRAGE